MGMENKDYFIPLVRYCGVITSKTQSNSNFEKQIWK